MKMTSKLFTSALTVIAFFVPSAIMAQAPAAAPPAKAAPKTVTPKAPAATAQDIADAKAKGLVWVNLNSGVYHKDGEFYGKTKSGKFMTEDDAKKGGYRAAKDPAQKKAKPADTAKK